MGSPATSKSGVDIAEEEVSTLYKEEEESQLLEKYVISLDDAYKMYNDYAFLHGFGIKKWSSHKSGKDRHITSKTYVCCKQGKRKEDKEDEVGDKNEKRQKNETRCNCKAQLVVKPSLDGRWVVTRHDMEHSHPLLPVKETHLLLSHRRVSKEHIDVLERMVKAGIRTIDAYNYYKLEREGTPEIRFTEKDVYNALATRKKFNVIDGDAQELVNMFDRIQKRDGDFYYDYKVDEFNQLEAFFWRDKRMKDDYLTFGDLMVFDTTFKTNKYDLSCAPFVCMNQHRRNILVGCGFVKSETIASFIWLFNAFKKAMDDIQPQTLMTDQDIAMDNAIRECFPQSCHRLCTWHIGENSKKHLSQFYMKAGFADLFGYVLRRCDTEKEFYMLKNSLEQIYGVGEHKWFKKLFENKGKWSNVFNKEKFSGGAISSQRSESLNSCIKKKKRITMGLVDCYYLFCSLIKHWRRKERDDNVSNKIGFPVVSCTYNRMLQQAKIIYTIRAYKIVEEEYKRSDGCTQVLQSCIDGPNNSKEYTYHVFQKRHARLPEVRFIVHYRDVDTWIRCECEKMVYCGYLCCHALRIMNIHSVTTIPQVYYLKRWTREAKPETETCPTLDTNNTEKQGRRWHNWNVRLARNFQKLLDISENTPRARKICEDAYNCVRHDVELECGTVDVDENDECVVEDVEPNIILNPATNRKKGERNDRFKSTVEKMANQKKKGRKTNANQTTPNQYATNCDQGSQFQGHQTPTNYATNCDLASHIEAHGTPTQYATNTDGVSLDQAHGTPTTYPTNTCGFTQFQAHGTPTQYATNTDGVSQDHARGTPTTYPTNTGGFTQFQDHGTPTQYATNTSGLSQIQVGQQSNVYIPRFDTSYSHFEGGPSTSRVDEDGRNLGDMERLLLDTHGTQNSRGQSSNELFTSYFLN